MRIIAPAIVLALFLGQVSAFWQYGHLFVAKIAYDKLQSTSQGQAALNKANTLLKVYSKTHPSMTNLENNYPFVECATFADEIKAKGGSWQSGWHFVDTPYFDQGGDAKDYPNFKFDENSIDKAIPSIMEWITNTGNYKSGFVYQTMQQQLSTLTEEERLSYAIRLLIHYIGDIHQPLHASSRVNPQYPKGDAGGNFIQIPIKEGAKNLHSVWDSVSYAYTQTPHMPFTEAEWSTLGNEAQSIVKSNPVTNAEWQNINVAMWSNESFEASKSTVYPGVKPNTPLTEAYQNAAQAAIKKLIVLGGYRLAFMIEHIFGTATQNVESVFLK